MLNQTLIFSSVRAVLFKILCSRQKYAGSGVEYFQLTTTLSLSIASFFSHFAIYYTAITFFSYKALCALSNFLNMIIITFIFSILVAWLPYMDYHN